MRFIRHVLPVGPVVRLELEEAGRHGLIEAELSRERYRALELRVGDRVCVRPRRLQVFPDLAGRA